MREGVREVEREVEREREGELDVPLKQKEKQNKMAKLLFPFFLGGAAFDLSRDLFP